MRLIFIILLVFAIPAFACQEDEIIEHTTCSGTKYNHCVINSTNIITPRDYLYHYYPNAEYVGFSSGENFLLTIYYKNPKVK